MSHQILVVSVLVYDKSNQDDDDDYHIFPELNSFSNANYLVRVVNEST